MPSPNNARKASTKKTPEKQVDLGPQLARRKSQDFATKIQGWNQTGAGILQKDKNTTGTAPSTPEQSRKKDSTSKEKSGEAEVQISSNKAKDAAEDKTKDASPVEPTAKALNPKSSPKSPSGRKPSREISLEKQAWVRRRSKPQVPLVDDTEEVKRALTPKKRVVSDGHWRRDRPKEEEPTPEKPVETTPKPIIVRRSVVSVGLRAPPTVQDFVESIEAEPRRVRPLRDSRSRSASRSDTGREGTPDYETTGTKVYIKRRRPSQAIGDGLKAGRDPRTSESSLTATSSLERPPSSTDLTIPSPLPIKDSVARVASHSRPSLRKSLTKDSSKRLTSGRLSGEDELAPQPASADRSRPKTPLRDGPEPIRGYKSAETYAKTRPVSSSGPPLAQHGNRIEGWLAGMSDPFTGPKDPSLTPEPLDISKKIGKASIESKDAFRGSPAQRRASGRRRTSQRDLDSANYDEALGISSPEDWTDMSPSASNTLKRSGARRTIYRSSGKGNPLQDAGSSPIEDAMMSGALPPPQTETPVRQAKKIPARSFPSAGKQLSTIASLDTLPSRRNLFNQRASSETSEMPSAILDGSVLSRASDGDDPWPHGLGPRRKSTKRSAIHSTYSMSRDDTHTIASALSIRERRRHAEPRTLEDVMNELSTEELKYQRELRTLVDGVIPVLLQYALSGSGSSTGNRVFSQSLHGQDATKPITSMGIALERLKTSHRKIPMHSASDLLTWANTASNVYSEYLQTWRLGFKNVIVNLAPADETSKAAESETWDNGIARNKDGDLVDNHGEQVDVAYLLKRPLVRLKYLTKTFKAISELQPSETAENMATKYHELVGVAKQRVNQESARLEDEAASTIDTTRARDPRSLAPISGVTIDPTRCVRARDYFDMELTHSSGQQLGCKIEIIYRDDAPDRGKTGDVLFCEVSTTGRWLLYPPMPLSLVSARKGGQSGELVVMIRGYMSNAQQWREVMSLQAESEQTSSDWIQMLGSTPMPPRMSKKSSFNMLKESNLVGEDRSNSSRFQSPHSPDTADWSREPSPREVEIPIGERAETASRIWDGSEVNSISNDTIEYNLRRTKAARHRSTPTSPTEPKYQRPGYGGGEQPDYFYEMPKSARQAEIPPRRPVSTYARSQSDWTESTLSTRSSDYTVWMPRSERDSDDSGSDDDKTIPARETRPSLRKRTASVPSLDLPNIPKLRPSRPPLTPRHASSCDTAPSREPTSAPAKLSNRRLSSAEERQEGAPASKSNRPTSLGLKNSILPSLTPAFLKRNRRPSSPLKHEYEPSTASDSLSDSDYSDLESIDSETSESTIDDDVISTIGDLKAFQEYASRPPQQPVSDSHFSMPGPSLAPSESASQAPYRTVPPASAAPAKTLASIFSWSERGTWEPLHPEECIIFVTPGLIEAFDLTQAHAVTLTNDDGEESTPSAKGVKPLVALELTPLVPLRRGTAVDISIRSPPTSNSLIRTGNNIMFRSQTTEECAKLYNLINRARIDNPTYIALQNARGPVQQSNWAEIMDRRNAERSAPGSWWNLGSRRGSTYRSNGSRAASTAATESSVGTMNTAFSALRRFSGGSRIFNIAKSTITSRQGTRSTNSESLSSGVATPVPLDPRLGTPLGITNSKVRLYVRDLENWRVLGPARLTVMLPPRPDPNAPADPKATGSEKRILIYGKTHGETMLDVTLGASAFGRVGRTGIAVNVFEDSVGPDGEVGRVAASGGVNPGRNKIYMIQMKSQRDATYTFGLVGSYWQ